ncbi:MAG: hypothetical protein KC800_09470 [Candidatus Eremiobacteraeota bacterium]|nr:hypothetical protein [Candidatus Eremiobacteraeota bacterium]
MNAPDRIVDDTAIITVFFGDDELRLAAAEQALLEQSKQDLQADHFLLELVDSQTQSRLQTSLRDRFHYIAVEEQDRNQGLFQKEALYNLGWKRALATKRYRFFIFTDADVYSADPAWFRKIRRRLLDDPSRLVQGFRLVWDERDPDFIFQSLGSLHTQDVSRDLNINPGLCWGLDARTLVRGGGFNPFCIEGGGDCLFVAEYLNHREMAYELGLLQWEWYARLIRDLPYQARLDAVEVDLLHCFHGKFSERRAYETFQALSRLAPLETFVKIDETGLLAWKDPNCTERRLLRRRPELVDEEAVERVLASLGLPVARKAEEFSVRMAPFRIAPWATDKTAPSRQGPLSLFDAGWEYGEFKKGSWSDNVLHAGPNRELPVEFRSGSPRLTLRGKGETDHWNAVLAVRPNWTWADLSCLRALQMTVTTASGKETIRLCLHSIEPGEREYVSSEVVLALDDPESVTKTIPLERFEEESSFNLKRVRKVSIRGNRSCHLEITDVRVI